MQTKQPNLLILASGFASSVLALLIVAFSNLLQFNIMGLHVNLILPVGALLIGVLAGSGYALASLLCHVKLRRDYLLIVAVVAVVTYTLSHYLTYLLLLRHHQMNPAQYSFLEYFRGAVEDSTFTTTRSNSQGTRLGVWGYGLIALEFAGFILGNMVPMLLLAAKPYCDHCQRYMEKVETVYHATELTKKDLKATKGKKEKQELLVHAVQDGLARFNHWWAQAQALTWPELEPWLDHWPTKLPKQTLAHVQCNIYLCDTCEKWHVIASLVNATLKGQNSVKQIHDSRTAPGVPVDLPPPPILGDGEGIQETR